MAFPVTPLGIEVELALGAQVSADPSTWLWTSITQYARGTEKVVITRGRPDEFSTAPPAKCSLMLLNDGRFVPRNTAGAYYGTIHRNTPLRVTVRPDTNSQVDAFTRTTSSSWGSADTGGAWTIVGTAADYSTTGSAGRFTCASAAVRHTATLATSLTTADITFRVRTGALATGAPLSAGAVLRYADASNYLLADLLIHTDASIDVRIISRVAGVDSTVGFATTTLTHVANAWYQVRVQTVGVIGQGGGQQLRIKAYLDGATEPTTWNAQATVSAPSAAGLMGLSGQRETGNTNASAVIEFDDYQLRDGARQRFTGYVKDWPTSFADHSAQTSLAPVTAYGLSQRLGVGGVLKSAMLRSFSTAANLLEYWPLEDNAGAQSAASAAGGKPMLPHFTPVRFGSSAGPPGSLPTPDLSSAGSSLRGAVRASTQTSWEVDFAVKVNPLTTGNFAIPIDIYTSGGIQTWEIVVGAGVDGDGVYLQHIYSDGSFSAPYITNILIDDGAWHWIQLSAAQAGGNTGFLVVVDDIVTSVSTSVAKTFGALSSILVTPEETTAENPASMSHVVAWAPSPTFDTYQPFAGWAGESASVRVTRLGVEESLPVGITSASTILMGPQGVQKILQVLLDVETTDQGILYDGTSGYLTLRPHNDRYNRALSLTLDVAAKQVGWPFTGTDDDLLLHNDVTASSATGTSYRYTIATGENGTGTVGFYSESLLANVSHDYDLPYAAQWRAHIGTTADLRYPDLTLNLTGNPELISAWLDCDIGHRMAVTNISTLTVLPRDDLDQFIEGYTETLSAEMWLVSLNTSAAKGWTVFVWQAPGGTAQNGRWDSDASTITTGYNTVATSFSVATTSPAPLWTTTETPFDIEVGGDGEQIRVTAVSGSSSPQTFTVTRSINGVALAKTANASVRLWRGGVWAL